MKTKRYEFTESEVLTLREALDHYYYEKVKNAEQQPNSPIAIKMRNNAEPLLKQFNDDIRLSFPTLSV